MTWNFKVGDRVVCVDDGNFRTIISGYNLPKFGDIYTVREICCESNEIMVLLCEIVNPEHHYSTGFHEGRFFANRFRPLVSKGMTTLRSLLVQPPLNRDIERFVESL